MEVVDHVQWQKYKGYVLIVQTIDNKIHLSGFFTFIFSSISRVSGLLATTIHDINSTDERHR